MQLKTKHLITGNELGTQDLQDLLKLAIDIKQDNTLYKHSLQDKHIAILFEKPSLRTRFSFTVAVNQLGGNVVESINSSRKHEEPEDLVRVIQGFCQGLMIRTFKEDFIHAMLSVTKIPIINGLTDNYHPCQILADLLTLKECFGDFAGLKIAYIGDGNNILHSLLIMATKLGIQVNYACPAGCAPLPEVINIVKENGVVHLAVPFATPAEAVQDCQAVYTDVWTSMGFETANLTSFDGYQVNEQLLQKAAANAVFMHCMPMNRGEEISASIPDQKYSVIFQQSENRLHIQKALLISLFN